MKIVTPTEMARLERDAAAFGRSTNDLMERAGLAIAREIRRALGGVAGRRVLTLVGPGNNGGDGLVAARHLARWGASVILYLATNRHDDDPNLRLALSEGAQAVAANGDEGLSALERALRSSHVVHRRGARHGQVAPPFRHTSGRYGTRVQERRPTQGQATPLRCRRCPHGRRRRHRERRPPNSSGRCHTCLGISQSWTLHLPRARIRGRPQYPGHRHPDGTIQRHIPGSDNPLVG